MIPSDQLAQLVEHLSHELPLLALYVFGSHAQGNATPASDLDLAAYCSAPIAPLRRFELTHELEKMVGMPVDLVDFGAASTVFQYQILTTGCRLWSKDGKADVYEAFVMSEKLELDHARGPLLADIMRRGYVYGR